MPPGSRCVTRPSKYGNPFRACDAPAFILPENRVKWAVDAYRWWLMFDDAGKLIAESARVELSNLSLLCFCPVGKPCHADVLLEAARGDLWENWRLSGNWLIGIRESAGRFNATAYSIPSPFNGGPRVLHEGHTVVGSYATRDEAFLAAENCLAIHRGKGVKKSGRWMRTQDDKAIVRSLQVANGGDIPGTKP